MKKFACIALALTLCGGAALADSKPAEDEAGKIQQVGSSGGKRLFRLADK